MLSPKPISWSSWWAAVCLAALAVGAATLLLPPDTRGLGALVAAGAVLALGAFGARVAPGREDRAEESEGASAVRAQLATASHEIRTPLSGLLGMTQLLLDTPLDDGQRRSARGIQKSAVSMLALVDDLLDLSRGEAGRLELETADLDLREVVEDAIEPLAALARQKGLALRCVVADDVPRRVRGDALRIRQVLTNLVGNALKFTEHGEVALRVERGADPEPERSSALPRTRVDFTVTDTGIGMSEEAQARIFEPFRQADETTARRFGGSGLGLAISRQLVERMGGEIDVASAPGRGSRFHFGVPLALAGTEEAEIVSTGPTEPQQFEACLLLAEDDDVNREVALAMLQSLGCRVRTAQDGREAVETLQAAPMDLVLLDWQMPVLDGVGAAQQVRALGIAARGDRHLPLVGLTARAGGDDREACIAAGMDDVVSKPFTRDGLRSVLERWIPHTRVGSAAAAAAPGGRALREDVLDGRVLAQLRALETGGAEGLVARVAEVFLSTSDRLARELRDAAAADDPEAMSGAAHRLKSSGAQVGALRLASLAKEVEARALEAAGQTAAGQTGAGETRTLLGELLTELEQVKEALAVECFGVGSRG